MVLIIITYPKTVKINTKKNSLKIKSKEKFALTTYWLKNSYHEKINSINIAKVLNDITVQPISVHTSHHPNKTFQPSCYCHITWPLIIKNPLATKPSQLSKKLKLNLNLSPMESIKFDRISCRHIYILVVQKIIRFDKMVKFILILYTASYCITYFK